MQIRWMLKVFFYFHIHFIILSEHFQNVTEKGASVTQLRRVSNTSTGRQNIPFIYLDLL